jgi:hypothetical protein
VEKDWRMRGELLECKWRKSGGRVEDERYWQLRNTYLREAGPTLTHLCFSFSDVEIALYSSGDMAVSFRKYPCVHQEIWLCSSRDISCSLGDLAVFVRRNRCFYQ